MLDDTVIYTWVNEQPQPCRPVQEPRSNLFGFDNTSQQAIHVKSFSPPQWPKRNTSCRSKMDLSYICNTK